MALSPQPPIPVQAPPFLLSLPTMEWLLDQGGLRLNPASPFGFLAVAARRTTPEEREAAARRELGRRPRASLIRALDIAAQPDAQIRLTKVSPGQAPEQVIFLRRGFAVAQAGFNTEGFFFGEPMQVGELQTLLISELRSESPSIDTTDRLIPPRALVLLAALWPQGERPSVATVPVSDALVVCQRMGVDATTARDLIDALIASQLVNDREGALSLEDGWRPWIERLWSGELFEVEVTPLPDGPFDATQLIERREHLVFVGPRGQRIVSRAIDATSLDEVPLGVPFSSDQPQPLVALSYLDGGSVERVLGALLRLTEEGLLTRGARVANAGGGQALP